MKSLKSLLAQPLTWSFKKRKILLKSNDEVILELKEEKGTKASFELRGKKYMIRSEGFWNLKILIEKEGKHLLALNRQFLGSKATVKFANGNVYTCKVKNSPLVKLSFFTEKDEEILHYNLEPASKPKTVLTIINPAIMENELLMLIILGCYSFKGIMKENDDADFITIVAAGA